MTQPLRACVDCGRHIRIVETHCPFCAAALPGEFHKLPHRATKTLGRAAALLIGTTATAAGLGASAAMNGCGGAEEPTVLSDAANDRFVPGDTTVYGIPYDQYVPPPNDGSTDAKDGALDGDGGTADATDGSADGGAD